MVKQQVADTRTRLVEAALAQVAARGFDGVSVGDIEAGAGLAPRSGALYKYFDSKLALLEAGLEQHLDGLTEIETDLVEVPMSDVRSEIELVARAVLAELDRERTITQVIEREGDRLPALRDRMRANLSDRGYRLAATFMDRWARARQLDVADADALAVLLIGGLINLRRSTWTFGSRPLGVSDDRVVAAFASVSAALLAP